MSAIGRVIGWKLDRDQRKQLLEQFPPRYADVIADHVTLKTNSERKELPGPAEAAIVGRADDEDSLECLVVTINGLTARRFTSPGRWTNRRAARHAKAMTC